MRVDHCEADLGTKVDVNDYVPNANVNDDGNANVNDSNVQNDNAARLQMGLIWYLGWLASVRF